LPPSTPDFPIVLIGITDPVGAGLVASLAHPGGNLTGLASSYDDTVPKQMEMLAAFIPNPARIGYLRNPENPASAQNLRKAQEIAQKAGLSIVSMPAQNVAQIESAFATLAGERVQAVMLDADAMFTQERHQLAAIALRHRLPTIFPMREFPDVGGLMSYGENRSEFYRRAASFADKIFKGAKAGDLPIEQPTRFHLVINRKTADALGVTIPPQLYIFADEVIE
jgi:ABC-type uncharacterized transport system substrate-binding protein